MWKEVKMKKRIYWYLWFIKESQGFMKGYNPIITFLKSLYKGIEFTKDMVKYENADDKWLHYINMDRTI